MQAIIQAIVSIFMAILSIFGLFGPKEPETAMKKVGTIPSFGNIKTVEGGCTDGTYIYQTLIDPKAEDGSVPCRIVKISAATMKTVKVSEDLSIDHANDVTYNSSTNELIVCNNKPNYSTLTFVDPETLEIKGTRDIDSKVYSVVYVGNGDFYYAGISRTFTVVEMNSDFEVTGSFDMIDNGYTRQTIDTDGEFIYAVYYKENYIYKYDVNGNFIGRCKLPVTENEAENIFFIGNTMYVAYNILTPGADGEEGGIIYRLDNAKYEK
jgi:DNA-binding beta-propeller fold protein YncE